jgi:hypothetical protein
MRLRRELGTCNALWCSNLNSGGWNGVRAITPRVLGKRRRHVGQGNMVMYVPVLGV